MEACEIKLENYFEIIDHIDDLQILDNRIKLILTLIREIEISDNSVDIIEICNFEGKTPKISFCKAFRASITQFLIRLMLNYWHKFPPFVFLGRETT